MKSSWQNFEGSFTYATDAVLNTNGRMLFNLNGVDHDFALTINSSPGLYDQLAEYEGRSLWEESKVTECALSRILNNKKLLKHTQFYEGGETVDIKHLLKKVVGSSSGNVTWKCQRATT